MTQEQPQHQEQGKPEHAHPKKPAYDRIYKIILILPLALLIFSFVYMFQFYQENKDFIHKDISLTGGTSITVNGEVDIVRLKDFLNGKLEDFQMKEISDLRTGKKIAIIIETKSSPDEAKKILEEFLGYTLDEKNSSIEFSGESISAGFYKQLQIAMIAAFILMSIVVFFIFRTFVPGFAIILSAFADILMTLVVVDIFGFKVSSAGIIAFLMLIGYSVDSDILLTTRVLKTRGESINARLWSAFKTGMTMTLTSLAAVLVSLFIVSSISDVLQQIFTILTIGLFFDIFNTWITNASILKWYAEKKRLG